MTSILDLRPDTRHKAVMAIEAIGIKARTSTRSGGPNIQECNIGMECGRLQQESC